MNAYTTTLLDVAEAIQAIYGDEPVNVTWEGGKKVVDGETWFEVTTFDGGATYTDWYTVRNGELVDDEDGVIDGK